MHAPTWWKRGRDAARRDDDERAERIRLLAMRDALLAVVAVSLALPIFRQFLAADQRMELDSLVGRQLPVFVLTIVALVLAVSWSIHGGFMRPAAAAYRVIWVVAGIVGGTAVLAALAALGPVPLLLPASLFGLIGGALVLFAVVVLLSRPNR